MYNEALACNSDSESDVSETTSTIFSSRVVSDIDVYPSRNPYNSDEKICLKISDENGLLVTALESEDLFYKDTVEIGKQEENYIFIPDTFVSSKHCKLFLKKWFRTRRLWVKQYAVLLKHPNLPFSLCKHIISFLQEPRHVLLKDCRSLNGTLIALKPSRELSLSNGQKFRFAETLDLRILHKDIISLKHDESFDKLEDVLKELPGSRTPEADIANFYDLYKAEERESRTYKVMSFKIKFRGSKAVNCKYNLVTNKSHASFIVGSNLSADIYIKYAKLDEFQFEILFKNGEWLIKECYHEDKKKRTWLNLNGEEDKEYRIIEDTDILIGKTVLNISFPNL